MRRPEGSIAKGYLAEECLSFCSLYLADYIESKFNQPSRNEDRVSDIFGVIDVFTTGGNPIGKGTATSFDAETLKKAHQYVLFNCEASKPFVEQHLTIVKQTHSRVSPHQIERIHSETFADWFAQCVEGMQLCQEDLTSRDLKLLANRPNFIGRRYEKFLVNGFRFHTKYVQSERTTQNSGVIVKATTSSFSSTRDQNPILGELDYFGVLTDIIELDYGIGRRVVLFECDWVSKGNKLRQDVDGFTLANFTNMKRHNEPFILASQANQVFYVEDPTEPGWHVIVATSARAHYDMEPMADVEAFLQSNICNPINIESEEFNLVREDAEGTEIDIS